MLAADVQSIVDQLSVRLQRSVVIDDPHVRLLYSSAHFGDEDPVRIDAMLNRQANSKAIGHVLAQGVASWTRAGVIPPNPDLGLQARVCVPVRWRGELIALVMVMDAEGTVTTGELAQISGAAEQLAPLLAAELLRGEETQEQTVLDLISTEPAVRRRALADLADGKVDEDFSMVTALWFAVRSSSADASPAHVSLAMRSALSMPGPTGARGHLGAGVEQGAVLLLASKAPLSQEALKTHAARMLTRVHDLSSGRFTAVAGIGPSVPGLERAHETAELAALASRAAGLRSGGSATTWQELGAYGPLLRIPKAQLGRQALPAEVLQLLEIDRDGQLAATLRAFLDAAGSVPTASAALHIHRTTLYYRLTRIQELTGLDLADGRTRLTIHLGLTLLDLMPRVRQS